MTKMDRNKKWVGIKGAVLLACALLLPFSVARRGDAAANEPAITPGSAGQARDYYIRISGLLTFDAKPGVTTLDDFLTFVGYPTSGAKLEALDSDVLMDPVRAASADALNLPTHGLNGATLRDGDILASRFFAPKIVNISVAVCEPRSTEEGSASSPLHEMYMAQNVRVCRCFLFSSRGVRVCSK